MEKEKIKAEELRIGNLFNYDHNKSIHQGKIYCINYTSATIGDLINRHTVKYSNLIPIPLTEWWVIRFGAQEIPTHKTGILKTYKLGGIIIEVSNSGIIYHRQYNRLIPYVHTLQNLTFAINNIELTPKE